MEHRSRQTPTLSCLVPIRTNHVSACQKHASQASRSRKVRRVFHLMADKEKTNLFNRFSMFIWCCRSELNRRPLPYQGSALPLSYGSIQEIRCLLRFFAATQDTAFQLCQNILWTLAARHPFRPSFYEAGLCANGTLSSFSSHGRGLALCHRSSATSCPLDPPDLMSPHSVYQ